MVNLEKVTGDLLLWNCKSLNDLGKLKEIETYTFSQIQERLENFPNHLIKITNKGGDLETPDFTNFKSLNKLKEVHCNVNIIFDSNSKKLLTSLNPIERIEGNLKIGGFGLQQMKDFNSKFNDISSLKLITKDLDLYYYPNDTLKINQNLVVGKNILINSYTNKNIISQIPKHLRTQITDKFSRGF